MEGVLKHCNGCGSSKPLSEFSRDRRAYDGVQSRCKTCRAAMSAQWAADNPEKQNASRRDHQRQGWNDAANVKKRAARRAVQTALEAGRLTRPSVCDGCGDPKPVQAHHRDYSRPLDVDWFCTGCHREAHKKEGAVV